MTITTYRGSRPRGGRAARFGLDLAEWLVLRSALLRHAPDAATPAGFDPGDFGLAATAPLTDGERRAAWQRLHRRGLATEVPATDDPAALVPAALPGLALLLEAQVRVDVQGWSGDRAVTQAVAWDGSRTAALARRRRTARPAPASAAAAADGGPAAEQEPVVELSLSSAGPVPEVLRALPAGDPAAGPVDPTPVTISWPESAAVVGALRADRADVAAHLAGLSPHALGLLGAVSGTITGGASVSGRRRRGGDVLGFRRVWLWTAGDVVELVTATEETVTLRRTEAARLRTDLLTALTGLAHAGAAA